MKRHWLVLSIIAVQITFPALADSVSPDGVGRIRSVTGGTFGDVRITRKEGGPSTRPDHLFPDDLVTIGKAGVSATIEFCAHETVVIDDRTPEFLVPAACSFSWSQSAYRAFSTTVAALLSPLSDHHAKPERRELVGTETTPQTFRDGERIRPSRLLPATEQRVSALSRPALLPVRWLSGAALVVLTSADQQFRYEAKPYKPGMAYLDVPALPTGRYTLRIAGDSTGKNDLLIPVSVVDASPQGQAASGESVAADAQALAAGQESCWQSLISLEMDAQYDFTAQVFLQELMDREDI